MAKTTNRNHPSPSPATSAPLSDEDQRILDELMRESGDIDTAGDGGTIPDQDKKETNNMRKNKSGKEAKSPGKSSSGRSKVSVSPKAAAALKRKPKSSAVPLGQKKDATKTTKTKTAAPRGSKVAASPHRTQVRPGSSLGYCVCGCGEEVSGYFKQGHDARFKGWMNKIQRGDMKPTDLPTKVQASFKFVKKGDGYVPTTLYTGAKNPDAQ